jgi:hypothetical protein
MPRAEPVTIATLSSSTPMGFHLPGEFESRKAA